MAGYTRIRYTGPETMTVTGDGPVTHPSINRARRGLTSFMRRKPLTTTPRRRQWRIRAGAGGPGAQAPKFSRTLDTLWSTDFQKKIVNMMPPDVRF